MATYITRAIGRQPAASYDEYEVNARTYEDAGRQAFTHFYPAVNASLLHAAVPAVGVREFTADRSTHAVVVSRVRSATR